MPRDGATPSVSLERWKHAAVQEVHLQSGAGVVKQRPGTLWQAIKGGRIPNPLLPLAVKVEYEGLDPKTLDAEELAAFEDFKSWYIAETVIEPKITPEDVAELPSGDREQLWLNALHLFDNRLAEALTSLAEYRPFRDGGRSGAASGDGSGSGTTSE